jgi:hypothetical protein
MTISCDLQCFHSLRLSLTVCGNCTEHTTSRYDGDSHADHDVATGTPKTR